MPNYGTKYPSDAVELTYQPAKKPAGIQETTVKIQSAWIEEIYTDAGGAMLMVTDPNSWATKKVFVTETPSVVATATGVHVEVTPRNTSLAAFYIAIPAIRSLNDQTAYGRTGTDIEYHYGENQPKKVKAQEATADLISAINAAAVGLTNVVYTDSEATSGNTMALNVGIFWGDGDVRIVSLLDGILSLVADGAISVLSPTVRLTGQIEIGQTAAGGGIISTGPAPTRVVVDDGVGNEGYFEVTTDDRAFAEPYFWLTTSANAGGGVRTMELFLKDKEALFYGTAGNIMEIKQTAVRALQDIIVNGRVIEDGTTASSGPGAVAVTGRIHEITTTGTGDALTLADGAEGQRMSVVYVAEAAGADTAIVTPTNLAGAATIITFNAIGDTAEMLFTAGNWFVMGGSAVVS